MCCYTAGVMLHMTFTPHYPNEAPNLEVRPLRNIDLESCSLLEQQLEQEVLSSPSKQRIAATQEGVGPTSLIPIYMHVRPNKIWAWLWCLRWLSLPRLLHVLPLS